jgi:hypothetical protein
MRYQTGREFAIALRAAADCVRSEMDPALAHEPAAPGSGAKLDETASMYIPEENS